MIPVPSVGVFFVFSRPMPEAPESDAGPLAAMAAIALVCLVLVSRPIRKSILHVVQAAGADPKMMYYKYVI